MGFVSDCVAGGRIIRALTLVDDYTRECLAIEVDSREAKLACFRKERAIRRLIAQVVKPKTALHCS